MFGLSMCLGLWCDGGGVGGGDGVMDGGFGESIVGEGGVLILVGEFDDDILF